MFLENINSPSDLKKLSISELNSLSDEIRIALITRLSKRGGHCGPNFGMVEATIAMHYVFNSPTDKIVFDVSHQAYTHKMLTGRNFAYTNPDRYEDVTGYTDPKESEHDFFTIGHTSTSISLASGLAKARDLVGGSENIIAVIGDGSLSGGEALEGLDYAGELDTNFIIIVNDNQMSIAENHGGLYRNLEQLRRTNGQYECNLFRAMGLDYIYVDNGNDISSLIEAFNKVKGIDHPIVVHINTIKGKGFAPAERDKEKWHYCAPFDYKTEMNKLEQNNCQNSDLPTKKAGQNYPSLTAEYLLDKMAQDPKVVAISSGTPAVIGFTEERRIRAGKQFVDVGIAEEHAIALASGIAAAGGKPVYGVVSSFVQRCYDQLSQDLCINNNPAVILVYQGSLTSMRDITHLCFFDIPLISNIPNMVYLAPTNRQEYFAMLHWSMEQNSHPVAIRVPTNGLIDTNEPVDEDYGKLNTYKVTAEGSDVAIIGLGSFYQLGEEVAKKLFNDFGINATIINPRYITGVDSDLLNRLKENHKVVVTLEDGILDGGFGEKIARFYSTDPMLVITCGARKAFEDNFEIDDFMRRNHLTVNLITDDIHNALCRTKLIQN